MTQREVKVRALRHLAGLCRNEPTDSPLWERDEFGNDDSFAADLAGVRAAKQFHAALIEIAAELEAEADRLADTPARRAFAARMAEEHRRAARREE